MADEDHSDNLRKFVTEECKAQAADSPPDPNDATGDAERMNKFYQRALNESVRMSNEVTKSHIQRNELHKELGVDMFESWTKDHAQQVLTAQQNELWSAEEEKAKRALQQLEKRTVCDDESSDDASH